MHHLPESPVLLHPGAHHLWSELWTTEMALPPSDAVWAAPLSLPAMQQMLLLPGYSSQHPSILGRQKHLLRNHFARDGGGHGGAKAEAALTSALLDTLMVAEAPSPLWRSRRCTLDILRGEHNPLRGHPHASTPRPDLPGGHSLQPLILTPCEGKRPACLVDLPRPELRFGSTQLLSAGLSSSLSHRDTQQLEAPCRPGTLSPKGSFNSPLRTSPGHRQAFLLLPPFFCRGVLWDEQHCQDGAN